jgi:hypothetical protein
MSANWNYNPLAAATPTSNRLFRPPRTNILNDPITFFQNNLVVVMAEGGCEGVQKMSLRPSTKHTCHSPMGMPVYELWPKPDTPDNTFRAYWLPYMLNAAYSMKLGDRADLMFTPTMDGCSFTAGGSKTSPLVAHLNYQNPQGLMDQAKVDKEIMRIHRWESTFIQIHRTDYRFDTDSYGGVGGKITTFAVRDRTTNRWDFWVQKRQLFEPAASAYVWQLQCLVKAA